MITLIRKNNNTINKFCVNINQYNEAMDKLTSYKLECGCGIKGKVTPVTGINPITTMIFINT